MKKLFLALMAVMAIVLSSCKHDTCTLYAANEYSKNVCFIFSYDKDCRSIEKADFYYFVAPGKVAIWKGVKVKGLYAIPFISVGEVKEGNETLEGFECQGSYDLSSFDGWASVMFSINGEGMPSMSGGNML